MKRFIAMAFVFALLFGIAVVATPEPAEAGPVARIVSAPVRGVVKLVRHRRSRCGGHNQERAATSGCHSSHVSGCHD